MQKVLVMGGTGVMGAHLVPELINLPDGMKKKLTEGKEKAASTLRKQDSMWRNHIELVFGDQDVNDITIVDLKAFLVNLYQTYSYTYEDLRIHIIESEALLEIVAEVGETTR